MSSLSASLPPPPPGWSGGAQAQEAGAAGMPGMEAPGAYGKAPPSGEGPARSEALEAARKVVEEVKGYQTIIMVYRDHELSKQATGPWAGVPACIWDMQGAEVPEKLQNAKVWLNGEQINPCATSPPMQFCVATFEYPSPGGSIGRTETEWEGAVAEFLAYDGKLTEEERQGIEEYLRQKWISEVHISH